MKQMEMEIEGSKPAEDTRLSYSSASLLRGCEQKYFYYKVAKVDIDPDQSKDSKAFNIGKAFHYILEESMHEHPKLAGLSIEHLLNDCVDKFDIDPTEKGLVHAMVLKYLRLRSKQRMQAIACEYAIKDTKVVGFIDLIEADLDTGLWWITDLKTAKTFYPTTVARLPKDRQLNLYAAFCFQIAEVFGLDVKKFGGCRYRVTTKSTAKQRKSETYEDYVMRMVDSYIKSYDVIIPKEKMSVTEVTNEFYSNHTRTLELREGAVPKKNFGYCEAYFKPCEYWSRCHGSTFTEIKEGLEVIEEI